MFHNFMVRVQSRRLANLRFLLSLERRRPVAAYLLAGLLYPLCVPSLPDTPESSKQPTIVELFLGAIILLAFLWYAAGPLFSSVQPVLTELGGLPGSVLWGMVAVLLLSWRIQAGARYLDQVRLTMDLAVLESRE